MSKKHPIIATTGSSGAGTTTVRFAFEHIFFRESLTPVFVEGDSFHRFDREGMRKAVSEALADDRDLSHFGPEGNMFEELETCFSEYARSGTGARRYYNHTVEEALDRGGVSGEFTVWQPMPSGTDLMFYEGLHGGLVDGNVDVAQHVDLLIGVVPIVNLEWIQKIHRDTAERGYDPTDVAENILRRMPDYVHYITPQFSLTDVNFQRVPTVDTSNPFTARDIPTLDESFVVIHFKNPDKLPIDFPYLLTMIQGSFMSRRNTIVVPGGKMGLAIEILFTPIIEELMRKRAQAMRRV
jgi:phosphoribulokinase